MTTTDDIMKLADDYAELSAQAMHGRFVSTAGARNPLRAAISELVAERDALKADAGSFAARMEALQINGHTWLTIPAILYMFKAPRGEKTP